jgi:anti-sigma-K factor RskA
MDTEHVSERIPAYVLEILDLEERRIVNSHLSECVSCRRELAEYRAAMDLLAESLPPREPPDRLRSLVLQKVARAASHQPVNAVQRTPVQGFWDSLKSFLVQPAGLALVLLLLVLNIGLAINTIHLNRQLSTIQARLPSSDIRVVPMAGTDQAPGSTGYMMIFTNETAGTLAVREAPTLEPGYQYQVWLIKDGKRTSGGVFSVNGQGYGSLQIEANQPLQNYQAVGITIEPTGGSPAPTGAKVLGGNL